MADEKKIPATPVPAATVLLIRDTDDGIEVFMVERSNRMHFASALVFPGGLVDPEDSEDRLLSRCDGIAGLSTEEAALRIAGVRETFEECIVRCADEFVAAFLFKRLRAGPCLRSSMASKAWAFEEGTQMV